MFLCPTFFLCKDEKGKCFLFMENNYYKINPNQKSNVVKSLILLKQLQLYNANFKGFIQENKLEQSIPISHARSEISENEIIIFGKKDSDLFLYYYIEEKNYQITIDITGEKISCKLIKSIWYICAFFQSNKIKISILAHIYVDYEEKGFKIVDTKDADGFSDTEYDNLILYDTNDDNYKVICASKKDGTIKCSAIYITVDYEYNMLGGKFDYDLDFKSLKNEYQVSLSEEHKGYLTGFYGEFISCYAEGYIITCYRNNKNNFDLINQFLIFLTGDITNLIITNNTDYAIISYKNESSTQNYLYQYYIYPPVCNDISKQINSFGEFEINLKDLFKRETNTEYFIKFDNLPSEYGIIELENIIISNTDDLNFITPKMNKLSFTSNNYEVLNNYEIFFNISIAETYSSVCKIILMIKECYQSCKGCLHDKDSATVDNHGCINCKEEQGYYPSPEDSTNCFTKTYLENTYLNYYCDETLKIFKKCHDDCKRCNGPTDEDCLICNDEELFLHNGKCISECPLETFESSDLEGKKCQDCYPNCETCNGLGNPENMKCSTCHGNQIKYRQNCLTKYDDKIKSFHNPVNFDIITSCYKLYGNYIIENKNECIDLIPSGYFISNLITGLLSPCHPKCLTCSKSFTAHNSNCDTCVGVLKLE